MFDTHQEHLDHSAPCASRWDGFDRGDRYDADERDEWLASLNEEFDDGDLTRTAVVTGCDPDEAGADVDMDEEIHF